MSAIDGSSPPAIDPVNSVAITVDIDPVWMVQPKLGGGTYGDLWVYSVDGWTIPTAIAAYFVDLANGIAEREAPEYAPTRIPGRAEAYLTYMGTSNKEVPLTFRWSAQVPDSSGSPLYSPAWCMQQARFLELLSYPVYDLNTDITYAPPPVILRVGQILIMRAVLTTCNLRWLPPFEPGYMAPHNTEAETVFTLVSNYPDTRARYLTVPAYASVPGWNRFLTLPGAIVG